MTDWPTGMLDPLAPLVTIEGVTIRQRVGGLLFVRWADGSEDNYPIGFTVPMVEAEVRARLAATVKE